jgi:hypothetical protein
MCTKSSIKTEDMISKEEEEVLRECRSNVPQIVYASTRQDNKCSNTKKRLINQRY